MAFCDLCPSHYASFPPPLLWTKSLHNAPDCVKIVVELFPLSKYMFFLLPSYDYNQMALVKWTAGKYTGDLVLYLLEVVKDRLITVEIEIYE